MENNFFAKPLSPILSSDEKTAQRLSYEVEMYKKENEELRKKLIESKKREEHMSEKILNINLQLSKEICDKQLLKDSLENSSKVIEEMSRETEKREQEMTNLRRSNNELTNKISRISAKEVEQKGEESKEIAEKIEKPRGQITEENGIGDGSNISVNDPTNDRMTNEEKKKAVEENDNKVLKLLADESPLIKIKKWFDVFFHVYVGGSLFYRKYCQTCKHLYSSHMSNLKIHRDAKH